METKLTEMAVFVSQRIEELRSKKLQVHVANEAGYANQNMIALIKGGKVKVSIEKAMPLARALEVDEREFLILAFKQFHSTEIVDKIVSLLSVSSETISVS